MKTIALVSPATAGHHTTYLRLFSRVLLEQGYQVIAFTPDSPLLKSWSEQTLPAVSHQLKVFELRYQRKYRVPGPLSIFFDKLAWVRFIAQLIKKTGIKPDLVFHTWLDNCLTPGLTAHLTDLIFPYRWSGLYFHPWYLRQPMKYAPLRQGPLNNHHALQSSNCPAVTILDEGVAGKLQKMLNQKPVIVFPDIADDSPPDLDFEPVTQILAKANGRKIIGLLGVLSKRKNLLMLLKVARQSAVQDWFFVFAGELDTLSFSPAEQKMIADFVQSDPANCFFLFQRIPDEPQFNAVVNVCDILFAVYKNFLSSSNLLAKAAIFKKPILVSQGYCMGERVQQFNLGLTISEDDVSECILALKQLTQPTGASDLPVPHYEAYHRLHSFEQLRLVFKELLVAANL